MCGRWSAFFLMSVGCAAAPGSGSTSSTDCEAPPRTPLADWDEVTAEGVSVRDHIGFGLGTFEGPLVWADGDASTYVLVLREGRAWVAEAPRCNALLRLDPLLRRWAARPA